MVHCNEARGGKKDLVASFQLRGFPLFSFSKEGVERGGMMDFTGSQVETASLLGVRGYVAHPIAHRPLEERRGERGVAVDHAPRNRISANLRSCRRKEPAICRQDAKETHAP